MKADSSRFLTDILPSIRSLWSWAHSSLFFIGFSAVVPIRRPTRCLFWTYGLVRVTSRDWMESYCFSARVKTSEVGVVDDWICDFAPGIRSWNARVLRKQFLVVTLLFLLPEHYRSVSQSDLF